MTDSPKDLGRQFALDCLADPSTPTAGLDEHHMARAYRSCHETLMFLCGRQTGLIGLDLEAAHEYLLGFFAGLRER